MNKYVLILALLLLQGCSEGITERESKAAIKYCKYKGTELEYIDSYKHIIPRFKCVDLEFLITISDADSFVKLEEIK